jgi:hypothetical protein
MRIGFIKVVGHGPGPKSHYLCRPNRARAWRPRRTLGVRRRC